MSTKKPETAKLPASRFVNEYPQVHGLVTHIAGQRRVVDLPVLHAVISECLPVVDDLTELNKVLDQKPSFLTVPPVRGEEGYRDLHGYVTRVVAKQKPTKSGFFETNIFPGLVTVIGPTRAGKTEVISREGGVNCIIRFSEPYEQIDLDERAISAVSLLDAVSKAIVLSLLGYTVAIDGLRDIMYSSRGAALAGGISSSVYEDLINVNNLFANFGTSIAGSLNPMMTTDDDGPYRDFISRVEASTAAVVVVAANAITVRVARTESGRVQQQGIPVREAVDHLHPFKPLQTLKETDLSGSERDALIRSLTEPQSDEQSEDKTFLFDLR